MTTAQTFSEQYDALQCQWRQDAIHRKRHYLRYLPPCGPVDFVLVAKMPSIAEKEAKVTPYGKFPAPEPHYNLLLSMGDLILNYGAHRHLCKPGETYYLTDLGKCAIPAKVAKGKIEEKEFDFWHDKFLEELKLVAKPTATVIPIGSATGTFLKRKCEEDPLSFTWRLAAPILHWTTAAIVAAKMASSLFPKEWKEFQGTTGWEDLRSSTEEIFSEAGLSQYMDPVERRLKDKFADFHRYYMFTYKKEMPLRRPDVSDA